MLKSLKSLIWLKSGNIWTRNLESRGGHYISLLVLALVGWLGFMGMAAEGILVVVMSGVVVFEAFKRLDQGLPLMQIASLLAVLQWLVGPWIIYNVDLFYSTYYMRVPSSVYFSYAFPGTAAFVIGLLGVGVSVRQEALLHNIDRSKFMEIGILLAFLGFAGGLGERILSGGGLAFLCYLLSQLRYVAALYFLFSGNSLRWFCAGMSILPLFTGSAATGMFHDLLLWMGVIICYVYGTKKRKFWFTLILLVLGVISSFTIQGIKKSYRDKVWNDEAGSLVQEVKYFWSSPQEMISDETLSNAIIRINQGWIIAAIMQNVPSSEPYAMGDTFLDALTAALVPRLVFSDKVKAGGQVNFRRFTGLPIADNTSMGLSLLGEAYANAGPFAGVFLMLAMGGFMSLSYGLCLVWSVRHPTFYFWIPVIFCQTIKAETDFVTVLNHISKGAALVFFLYWVICIKLLPATGTQTGSGRFSNAPPIAPPRNRGAVLGK